MPLTRTTIPSCWHFAFSVGIFLCAVTSAVAQQPQRLRVLSYNIHHAEGVDGKLNLQRIAGVIRSVQPDLVALQEVDQNAARSGSVGQPQALARLTGMQVLFGANIQLQGGHYGNAVLSRFPTINHENHLLPNVDNGEQRGLLVANIEIPSVAATLLFLATHLDHRPADEERTASAQFINNLVKRNPKQPALLAGDLNDTMASRTLNQLEESWSHPHAEPLPTIPVDTPQRQIDFILFRPQERWKVVQVKVVEEATASDHRPILAVLELLP